MHHFYDVFNLKSCWGWGW